jgi:hypothetical protein
VRVQIFSNVVTTWRQQPAAVKTLQVAAMCLALWGATCGDAADIRVGPAARGPSDIDNQVAVLMRVMAGEPYYPVVAEELRRRGYPTNSPLNFRLPTLVWFLAFVGSLKLAMIVLLLLGVATTAFWCWHLVQQRRLQSIWLAVPLGMSMLPLWLFERAIHLNDLWAGQLIAFALATRLCGFVSVSLVAGAMAGLVREQALLFLLAMGATAFLGGARREGWAWVVVGLGAAGVLGSHILYASHLTVAGPQNQWLVAGGWCFALRTARMSPLLLNLPNWLHAALVPFLVTGAWMMAPRNFRLAAVLTIYLGCFLVVGRPDNAYWGLLIAPMLPFGALGWRR